MRTRVVMTTLTTKSFNWAINKALPQQHHQRRRLVGLRRRPRTSEAVAVAEPAYDNNNNNDDDGRHSSVAHIVVGGRSFFQAAGHNNNTRAAGGGQPQRGCCCCCCCSCAVALPSGRQQQRRCCSHSTTTTTTDPAAAAAAVPDENDNCIGQNNDVDADEREARRAANVLRLQTWGHEAAGEADEGGVASATPALTPSLSPPPSSSSPTTASATAKTNTNTNITPRQMIRRFLPAEGVPVDVIPPPIAALVKEYASKSPTEISLLDMMGTAGDTSDHITAVERFEDEWIRSGRHPYRRRRPMLLPASARHRRMVVGDVGVGVGGREGRGGGHDGHGGPSSVVRRRLEAERVLSDQASMLRSELPVRLARCIVDLDEVPRLRDMPSVQAVKGVYIRSLLELLDCGGCCTEAEFGQMLYGLYRKHSTVLLQMAQGAHELRVHDGGYGYGSDYGSDGNDDGDCQAFLDRFYTSRVGIRVLAGQYLALRGQLLPDSNNDNPNGPGRRFRDGGGGRGGRSRDRQYDGDNDNDADGDGYVGMICHRTSPYKIVQRAGQDATRLCVAKYGRAPAVHIGGRNLGLTFCYIPTHAHYILLELLKNAMRATMDFHLSKKGRGADVGAAPGTDRDDDEGAPTEEEEEDGPRPLAALNRHIVLLERQREGGGRCDPLDDDNIPPVTVIIADSPDNEDVTIKVSDEGGGIPRSRMDDIWSYLYTTADPGVQDRVLRKPTADAATTAMAGMAGEEAAAVATAAAEAGTAALASSPILAGLGFGLPLSRAHARYFGGDLDLVSLEGYGTDAYCYLVRLGRTREAAKSNDEASRYDEKN